MNNCLLILTNRFPFSFGEPFLETELPYHLKNFSKIIIFPLDVNAGEKPTRELPDGVEVFNISPASRNAVRFSNYIRGAGRLFKKTKVFRLEKAEIGNSISKKMFLEYFEARAQSNFSGICSVVENFDFSGFDNIIIYSYWLFVTARTGVLLKEHFAKRNSSIKLVSRAHGYDVYDYRNRLGYLPLRETLLNKTDNLFPCSNDSFRYLTEKYPTYKNKIQTAYLGTPDCGVNNAPADCFHIVSCSKTIPLKRVDRIISSLALLRGSGIKLKWSHIGGGEQLDGLRKTASYSLNFMEVTFMGMLPNQKVYDFYRENRVSLFINASSSEGLPVSIMEASSFGIPAVASNVGGTAEIVRDYETGRLLSADFSDNDLAELILYFTGLTLEEYLFYRSNARSCWEECFCAEKNYTSFSKLISE